MKVCILALPRSSSTNLFFTISKLHQFKYAHSEPFNIRTYKHFDINRLNNDNILIKHIFCEYNLPTYVKNLDELMEWVKSEFTHVICQYRVDTRSQTESFLYHNKQSDLNVDFNWHLPKIIDLNGISENEIESLKLEFEKGNKNLIKFAEENKYPIFKYEDLIVNEGDNQCFKEICDYLNIDYNYSRIYEYYRKDKKVSFKKGVSHLI